MHDIFSVCLSFLKCTLLQIDFFFLFSGKIAFFLQRQHVELICTDSYCRKIFLYRFASLLNYRSLLLVESISCFWCLKYLSYNIQKGCLIYMQTGKIQVSLQKNLAVPTLIICMYKGSEEASQHKSQRSLSSEWLSMCIWVVKLDILVKHLSCMRGLIYIAE